MMRSGTAYQLPTLAHLTDATGFGLSLTHKPTHSVPTPTASDHIERKSTSKEKLNFDTNKSVSLDRWVKMWPTPQASDNRDRGSLSSGAVKRRMEKGKQISLSQSVSEVSGQLNPMWVEWLMGFPIGHTDLKDLETP
jgi:DNA (cytosine-5)-methyltransferase 1